MKIIYFRWFMDEGNLSLHYPPKKWPWGGFLGIFVTFIAIFLVIPLFVTSFLSHLFLQTCFTLLILSVLYTMSYSQFFTLFGGVLIALFLIFDVLSIANNSLFLMAIAYIFYCVFLCMAIGFLTRHIFLSSNHIDTNLLFGAITIYLLAGIFWAKLFLLIDLFIPGSFSTIEPLNMWKDELHVGYENQYNLMYYSFTTISTLGLGDIAPLKHLTKSLTILEAMFGQLFIATAISKLVSIWHRS
jgi:voltage-gated potassium channel